MIGFTYILLFAGLRPSYAATLLTPLTRHILQGGAAGYAEELPVWRQSNSTALEPKLDLYHEVIDDIHMLHAVAVEAYPDSVTSSLAKLWKRSGDGETIRLADHDHCKEKVLWWIYTHGRMSMSYNPYGVYGDIVGYKMMSLPECQMYPELLVSPRHDILSRQLRPRWVAAGVVLEYVGYALTTVGVGCTIHGLVPNPNINKVEATACAVATLAGAGTAIVQKGWASAWLKKPVAWVNGWVDMRINNAMTGLLRIWTQNFWRGSRYLTSPPRFYFGYSRRDSTSLNASKRDTYNCDTWLGRLEGAGGSNIDVCGRHYYKRGGVDGMFLDWEVMQHKYLGGVNVMGSGDADSAQAINTAHSYMTHDGYAFSACIYYCQSGVGPVANSNFRYTWSDDFNWGGDRCDNGWNACT